MNIEHADLFARIRTFEESDVGRRIREAMDAYQRANDAYQRANDAYQRAVRALQPRIVLQTRRITAGKDVL
jgi:uncharacterized protein YPO0396